MNEYLESDAKNIVCSLYQIVAFIRQIKLKDKIANNILQITEFDFATWNFILSIYKSEYDKLNTNKNSNSFKNMFWLNSNQKTI